MISAHRHGSVVHIHAEGNDETDQRALSTIVAAYFEAEQARVFRQLLWKRLGAIALVALMFDAITRLISASTLAAFFALECGTAVVGAVVNRQAHRRLRRIVSEHSDRRC